MVHGRIFALDDRLRACANFIRTGSSVVDVGTDHGYLPIWLVKSNQVKNVIAVDVKRSPLENAYRNVVKYRVEDNIEIRLSNGLDLVKGEEADDIVIAGIGSDVIIKIIKKTSWLKSREKRLILQPMTAEESLRDFLLSENFHILDEIAVRSNAYVYSVMNIAFCDVKPEVDDLYRYVGKLLLNRTVCTVQYLERKVRHLKNQIKSGVEVDKLSAIISKLESEIASINLSCEGDSH